MRWITALGMSASHCPSKVEDFTTIYTYLRVESDFDFAGSIRVFVLLFIRRISVKVVVGDVQLFG